MKNIDEFKDILKVQGIYAKGFGTISKLVMQDQRLTIDAKAIYAYFCSFAGAGNMAFPSVNKICYDLKIKKFETFKKHRDLLKQLGYIKVEQSFQDDRKFGRNIYTLIVNPVEVDNSQFSPIPKKGESVPISKKGESEKKRIGKIGNPKKGESKINKDFKNNSFSKFNIFHKNNTHTEDSKNASVCVNQINSKIFLDILREEVNKTEQNNSHDNISLDQLREKAEKIIGEKLWKKQFESAMRSATIEKFKEHLSNWDIHKLNAKKPGAYFIQVLTNDIEPVKPEKRVYNQDKIPQRDNFEQREYSDEFCESCYDNFREPLS